MKRIVLLTVFATLLLSANSAYAWGSWAHKLITYTADKYLEDDVREKVEHYLGSPMINHCVWMDQIRRPIHRKDHPDHEAFQVYRPSLRWHHCVVDKNFKVSDARSKKGSGAMMPNLEKCIENLRNYRNLTDSAVAVNLKYTIHMLEDMHCPSHIFYTEFPDCFEGLAPGEKSRGFMPVYYNEKKTTFHAVWDGLSLRAIYPDLGKDYELFRKELDKYSAKQREKICKGTINDWASDAGRRCRPVYDGVEAYDHLDRDFLLKHREISEGQAMRSAYRIAHLLNEIFR